MTSQQIQDFRTIFKKIVYKKGLITEQNRIITRLHVYDKGGSHEKAILKAVIRLNELRDEYKSMLAGKSYDKWISFSKILSKLQSSIKSARHVETKEKIQVKINCLEFDYAANQ